LAAVFFFVDFLAAVFLRAVFRAVFAAVFATVFAGVFSVSAGADSKRSNSDCCAEAGGCAVDGASSGARAGFGAVVFLARVDFRAVLRGAVLRRAVLAGAVSAAAGLDASVPGSSVLESLMRKCG
jgi:hypothetical protein